MTNKVKPIPDGYHAVTPYLFIKGAGRAIEFYKKVFGAKERLRMQMPGAMPSRMQNWRLAIPSSCSRTNVRRWKPGVRRRLAVLP